MLSNVRILLVEDNLGDQIIVKKHLARSPSPEFDVTLCTSLMQAKQILESTDFDTILLDLTLPDSEGLETFFEINQAAPETPIIILTGLDVRGLAVEAVRKGAQDYLVKDENLQILLIRSILHGIERKHRLSHEIELAKTQAHMQAMQTFMQDVTHDLKTPLSVIMTSGELLSRYVALDNPKVVRHLQNILDQSDRLKHMINSILEMSELTLIHEIAPEKLHTVDIGIVIQKLTETLVEVANAQHVNLECVIGVESIQLYADESMLIRLLSNLIHNAIAHTPEGGNIYVKLHETKSNAEIKIIDTGIGIPPESLPYVFDRFYRVDKNKQGKTGNSGLGLSIVKRIVELHHGEISVDSKVNQGTQFTVTLPLLSNEVKI